MLPIEVLAVATPPQLPFPDYKWRWATLTPTEGLNQPAVYFGVLGVLARLEGRSKAAVEVHEGLLELEQDLGSALLGGLHLARNPNRNLLRNSGQYWSALGLLEPRPGEIVLTPLGRRLAAEDLSVTAFVLYTIGTLQAPNSRLPGGDVPLPAGFSAVLPLRVILKLLSALSSPGRYGCLSLRELCRVVIPQAPSRPVSAIAESIREFRTGRLNVESWPDVVPRDNDRRMAREFLIFLASHDLVEWVELDGDEVVQLTAAGEELLNLPVRLIAGVGAPDAESETEDQGEIEFLAREHRLSRSWLRPQQRKFRRDVLARWGERCALSGETIREVLQAAHIVAVEDGGPDDPGNGICLRADIHRLFDAGLIAISAGGEVTLDASLAVSSEYSELPRRINLPDGASAKFLSWRDSHGA